MPLIADLLSSGIDAPWEYPAARFCIWNPCTGGKDMVSCCHAAEVLCPEREDTVVDGR